MIKIIVLNSLEIKTSIVFSLVFAYNTILSCFFLYILIPAVIPQIFLPTAELVIPTRTPTNKANAEIKTQPLTAEIKTRKCSK